MSLVLMKIAFKQQVVASWIPHAHFFRRRRQNAAAATVQTCFPRHQFGHSIILFHFVAVKKTWVKNVHQQLWVQIRHSTVLFLAERHYRDWYRLIDWCGSIMSCLLIKIDEKRLLAVINWHQDVHMHCTRCLKGKFLVCWCKQTLNYIHVLLELLTFSNSRISGKKSGITGSGGSPKIWSLFSLISIFFSNQSCFCTSIVIRLSTTTADYLHK